MFGRLLSSFAKLNVSWSKHEIRKLSVSPMLLDSIRDSQRAGVKSSGHSQEVNEGTTGAGLQTSVNLTGVDNRFPTAETLKQNKVITYTSCRLEGFKNAKKKTTIAGQTTGVAAGHRLLRRGIKAVRVQVKGIGPGRMTCVKGLTAAGVNVISLTDHSALCELGPRPRKIRRI